MHQSLQADLIAPCGMNCALCIAYQAQQRDLNRQGFRRKYCSGCIPRGKHCLHMKNRCAAIGSGQLRFCYMCESFPCTRLQQLDTRYRTKYHMSMIDNLRYLQANGMEAFLQMQENKWLCRICGNSLLCCHNGLCLSCELDILKQNKQYRWGE